MRAWNFKSESLLEALGGEVIGTSSVTINDVATVDSPKSCSMMFATEGKFKKESIKALACVSDAFIVIEPALVKYFNSISNKNQVVVTTNARLFFAKALKMIVSHHNKEHKFLRTENDAIIGVNAQIGKNCILEPGAFVDNDVELGNNVIIKSGARIRRDVFIDDFSIVGENTVVGGQGFGIEKDFDGTNIRIPHIGGVRIGKNVEIGALSSIAAGTIAPTIIEDNCFIDDLVHIGHNCLIRAGTMVTACAQFGGSSRIGTNGFVAPNSTIRNGIKLGDNCFIGQSSSVQQSFGDNTNLVGNPARKFKR